MPQGSARHLSLHPHVPQWLESQRTVVDTAWGFWWGMSLPSARLHSPLSNLFLLLLLSLHICPLFLPILFVIFVVCLPCIMHPSRRILVIAPLRLRLFLRLLCTPLPWGLSANGWRCGRCHGKAWCCRLWPQPRRRSDHSCCHCLSNGLRLLFRGFVLRCRLPVPLC